MAHWEGYGVSVRCGSPLGCYQGTILAADGASITLTKPFRNGFPYPKAQVTLKPQGHFYKSESTSFHKRRPLLRRKPKETQQASDIKSLEIISGRNNTGTAHSTVPLAANKRRQARATVGESLQGLQGLSVPAPAPPPPAPVPVVAPVPTKSKPARSKPIDIQGRPAKNNTHVGSYGASGSTPKTRAVGGDKARRRNEACFGSAALEALDNDFDFEGNLALFDKEALWQQMRPDVVRVAAARDELAANGKLRHDQNVLRTTAPDTAPVVVPLAFRGLRDYVTDSGTRLPSVSGALRARLWAGLRQSRHAAAAAATLLARAAADVALRLVGGGRRLDPRNAHQRPCVGVAAGAGQPAAAAVAAARLLQAHGVDTYVLCLDDGTCPRVAEAIAAYRECGGRVLSFSDARPAADLLLLALRDPEAALQHPRSRQVVEWAAGTRGALVVLEPGAEEAVEAGARCVLCALLPPALAAPQPQLLLANIAPPPQLFSSLGITYRAPFGAASVLSLHLADDDD